MLDIGTSGAGPQLADPGYRAVVWASPYRAYLADSRFKRVHVVSRADWPATPDFLIQGMLAKPVRQFGQSFLLVVVPPEAEPAEFTSVENHLDEPNFDLRRISENKSVAGRCQEDTGPLLLALGMTWRGQRRKRGSAGTAKHDKHGHLSPGPLCVWRRLDTPKLRVPGQRCVTVPTPRTLRSNNGAALLRGGISRSMDGVVTETLDINAEIDEELNGWSAPGHRYAKEDVLGPD